MDPILNFRMGEQPDFMQIPCNRGVIVLNSGLDFALLIYTGCTA